MKKLLAFLWLAAFTGGSFLSAQTVLESVTNTATTSDAVNIPANAPWGVTANGRQARFKMSNDGTLQTSATLSPVTYATAVSITSPVQVFVTYTAAVSLSSAVQVYSTYTAAVSLTNPVNVNISYTVGVAGPITIAAVVTAYNTNASGVYSLNTALAFDYDMNTFTAFSLRGAPTINTYFQTSGTATIFTGYGLLYSAMIFPSSVVGSKVSFFDGTVTRAVLSATTASPYTWTRGLAFTSAMNVVVTGLAFDGGVSLEHKQ